MRNNVKITATLFDSSESTTYHNRVSRFAAIYRTVMANSRGCNPLPPHTNTQIIGIGIFRKIQLFS